MEVNKLSAYRWYREGKLILANIDGAVSAGSTRSGGLRTGVVPRSADRCGSAGDSAHLVNHRRNVDVHVGTHSADDNPVSLCHAVIFLSSNGDCATGRDGGQDSYGAGHGSY